MSGTADTTYTSEARAYASLAATFRSPPDEYGPNPAWWWTGERLDLDRLEWQMRQFHAGGLRQVTVISLAPHGPAHGFSCDDPPFYSDEWWVCFRHVASVARELGMRLWYFDHIGVFPTRFPAELIEQNPGFRARELARARDGTKLPPGAAVLTQHGGYTYYHAPIRVLDHYAAPTFYDLYNRTAGAALIDAIHGEMERRLGDLFPVIGGSFQDELRPLPSWSNDLPEAFRERTGRNLGDCLPALFDPTIDDPSARSAYHQGLACLAERAFFRPLHDWHAERGLLVVCDQLFRARTGDPLAGTLAYEDYGRTHRWFNGLGNDHNGAVKVHSSLVHLYDRPRTFLEAFHSSGWGGTLEETFHWLLPWFQRGSTLYGPHAIYYTTKGSWLEWAPPSTGFRQPYWRHYPEFASAVARICWLMSQGKHRCDVALFYPVSSVQAELGVSESRYDASWRTWRRGTDVGRQPSADAQEVAHTFWQIAGGNSWRWHGDDGRDDRREWEGALDRLRLDFDVIDEDSVLRAEVDAGRLAVAGESYRVLIFPQVSHLPLGVLDRAADLARNGGSVAFVGRLPHSTTERGPRDPELERLLEVLLGNRLNEAISQDVVSRELPGGGSVAFVPDGAALSAWLRTRVGPEVHGDVRALHRQTGDLDIFLVVPDGLAPPPPDRGGTLVAFDCSDATRLIDDSIARGPAPETVTVSVRRTGPVEQWDPLTGAARPAKILRVEGEWTTIEVDLTSAPLGLLVFGHAAEPAPPEGSRSWTEVPLGEEWDCELVPTADNRFGDFARPASDDALPVEVRVLRMAERDVVCGFGPRVEVAGPFRALDDHPTALLDQDELWRPAAYSTRIGIEKDPLHRQTLGPRARVPREFIDLGQPAPGSIHLVRTQALVASARPAKLRIVATGAVSAWLAGRFLGTAAGELVAPAHLNAGRNELVIALVAPGREATGNQPRLRAGFHFLPADAAPPFGHTLPDVPDWLNEEGQANTIPGLALDPHPELSPRHGSYSCRVPPGARSVRVPSSFVTRAFLDGEEIRAGRADSGEGRCIIDLPRSTELRRTLTVECELPVGLIGGGAFEGPLEFDCGKGTIGLDGWREEGLPHFVGGVRYGQMFCLDAGAREVILDLGRVRGTAEVAVNGIFCGARLWSPYRFELTGGARAGDNHLEITVFGTLGNYYMEGHPSPYGLRSQSLLGLLGPVSLRIA